MLYRDSVTVVKVSDELSLSKGFVSEYLSLLHKNKILQRDKKYRPVDSYLTRAIKVLLNVDKIKVSKIKKPFIKGMGIYGSWAYGTNNIYSDFDIWVKTDFYLDEKELAFLEKRYGKKGFEFFKIKERMILCFFGSFSAPLQYLHHVPSTHHDTLKHQLLQTYFTNLVYRTRLL